MAKPAVQKARTREVVVKKRRRRERRGGDGGAGPFEVVEFGGGTGGGVCFGSVVLCEELVQCFVRGEIETIPIETDCNLCWKNGGRCIREGC